MQQNRLQEETQSTLSAAPTPTPRRDDPAHKLWLAAEAEALFAFYQPNLIAKGGGFANLDERGRPMPGQTERPLHETTRMVHCFAIAHLLGRQGADDIVDHGMRAIRTRHRDARHGGYFWSFDDNGPRERDKLAYGHAFVLLAASSAKFVGHPEADRAARRHRRSDRDALLGAATTAPAPRSSARTGARSPPIAARMPICI